VPASVRGASDVRASEVPRESGAGVRGAASCLEADRAPECSWIRDPFVVGARRRLVFRVRFGAARQARAKHVTAKQMKLARGACSAVRSSNSRNAGPGAGAAPSRTRSSASLTASGEGHTTPGAAMIETPGMTVEKICARKRATSAESTPSVYVNNAKANGYLHFLAGTVHQLSVPAFM
jgi:hypothetical protein